MDTVKYTNSTDFRCLEDLRETSMELALVHIGKEECKPYHAFSGTRTEYIIHFILSGCSLSRKMQFFFVKNAKVFY